MLLIFFTDDVIKDLEIDLGRFEVESDSEDEEESKDTHIAPSVDDTYIQDLDGNMIRIGNMLKVSKILIILMRHYGCPTTRKIIYEILQLKPILDTLGVHEVVFIGCGTLEQSNAFFNEKPRVSLPQRNIPGFFSRHLR